MGGAGLIAAKRRDEEETCLGTWVAAGDFKWDSAAGDGGLQDGAPVCFIRVR